VPADIPDIIPVADPTEMIAELELVQAPPTVASLNVAVVLRYRPVDPDIGAGDELTVTVVVAEQPVVSVYVMLVVPAAMLVTMPVLTPIVATPTDDDDHEPPPASVSVVLCPVHIVVIPEIAAGSGFTVIMEVVEQPVARL
jgi:hypothetical protein